MRRFQTIVVRDREHLHHVVVTAIGLNGPSCDLNHFDVSGVTDMNRLFQASSFDGDISEWDVRNVQDMTGMFANAGNSERRFKGNLSKWNTAKVREMGSMFQRGPPIEGIEHWDVSNVRSMRAMFMSSKMAVDLSSWDVGQVENMESMFAYSKGKTGMGAWNVSNVLYFDDMFQGCSVKEELAGWQLNPKASIESMIDKSSLLTMKQPSVMHWSRMMTHASKSMRRQHPLWEEHFNTHMPILSNLGLAPLEIAIWLQKQWLAGPKPSMDALALPELG